MNKNLTDVTIVLDRSGSMESCKDEAQNGVNHFIDEQRKQDGDCLFSLVQFDTDYEFVHTGIPISDVPKFKLVPRGTTALLDAVGRAINETGERLEKIPESDRPGLVVFVIVTDGHENASSEFNRDQIRQMIERQQNEYQWEFTFLGANQDAFAEAARMGIHANSSANYDTQNSQKAFAASSNNVKRMRTARASGQAVDNYYMASERESMKQS